MLATPERVSSLSSLSSEEDEGAVTVDWVVLTAGIVAAALALLIVSFGRDVLALERAEAAEREDSYHR